MKYGSLFAGIGGMDLGLDRAGMTCAWQVEIDPYCRRVLAKHWPDVPKFEDVKECGSHNLEPVDLIAGGFPCQDISYAGKGAGIEGSRSGLWSEFHRIICELQPRYALVENVPALLGRGLGRVLGDLAESGYDAEWDCIPASAVGAPHRRDRVFIVAHAESQFSDGGNDNGKRGPRQIPEPGNCCFKTRPVSSRWATEPAVGRVAHGVPSRVDRLRGLGNAVVPQVAEYIGRMIISTALDGAEEQEEASEGP